MPDTLSSAVADDVVTNTLYNNLGQITEINLGNSLKTTYGYWGPVSSSGYDKAGDHYGQLWQIRTADTAGWLGEWDNRVKITVDHTKVDASLTHSRYWFT